MWDASKRRRRDWWRASWMISHVLGSLFVISSFVSVSNLAYLIGWSGGCQGGDDSGWHFFNSLSPLKSKLMCVSKH